MGKPRGERIWICDDLAAYFPGVWVEIRDAKDPDFGAFFDATTASRWLEGKPGEKLRLILSRLVVDWNLTDRDGVPLPKPWQNPDVFAELWAQSDDLWRWVRDAARYPSYRENMERRRRQN